MVQGVTTNAVKGDYTAAEALAPGWFQCRSDGWLAEQIAGGRAPRAAFEPLRACPPRL
mgnify:CR=1 FL=1